LRKESGVQARFLLGPAGSGKTFRCLAEIRDALRQNADGPPLILLAPKQATFQLERQLFAENSLNGYMRLHIFSFERLARFIFEKLSVAPPEPLNDEGRVMVLRALLMRHEGELKLFRQSARRPGFARHLGQLLRELQQHQFTPAKLRALAQHPNLGHELRDKLSDLALLHEAYANWLAEHGLQDENCLLDTATCALCAQSAIHNSQFTIRNLWLDGFAEMTPQESDLLAAVVPHCYHATLSFCLESELRPETSWLSIWSAVGKTFQQCRQRLENLRDCKIEIELLKREPKKSRFAENPALRHLEQNWSQPIQNSKLEIQNSVRVVACTSPETEAVFAAREILQFVRGGGRFRDCAVLVRDLENHHQPLARVFHRYEIPFFLDRRESVAHHPLAELTRSALRTVAFDWPHDDWFAALKAGFLPVDETEIDALENAALEFGWRGKKWREPLADEPLERLRRKILPPFENLAAQLARQKSQPTGRQLAGALRGLWSELDAKKTLEQWSFSGSEPSAIHSTVWEQMNTWLDNVALAFSGEALPLRDWLPVLETGLASLTVGVIPPVLDEVLVGAVDRARNPDLKLALVLGVNETAFPAAPTTPMILTGTDRDELEQCSVALGPNLRDQLARERYLGYIACTRASEKLVVTFSRHDADGKTLNPSSLVAQIQQLFPKIEIEEFQAEVNLEETEHVSEIVPILLKIQNSKFKTQNWEELLALPALAELAKKLGALREPDPAENLLPAFAQNLYGLTLKSSVSRLEEFAACPFRFFIHSGLRAEERKIFELDARERGSFQHEVLKIFHDDLTKEGKRWRDIIPADARKRVGKIAAEIAPDYRSGLLHTDAQSQFAARVLTESLQDFVETLVTWMRGQYEFDPVVAELDFGFDNSRAPAWKIDLGNGQKLALRGRIDRIDLCRETGDRALCVVMDYKSGRRKLDKILLKHGVQLQLPAYLAALCHWPDPETLLGVKQLVPTGVFFVNLRGQFENCGTRAEVLEDAIAARKRAYRHTGRFDTSALPKLDGMKAADQFNYRLNKDGSVRSDSVEALPRAEFEKMLDRVEAQLTEMGRAIFSGETKVDPYRKGSATACEFCDYRAACRIDPWRHQWRVLRAQPLDVDEIPDTDQI
jgi:ATP-dependent helicase/nuclease subunit B